MMTNSALLTINPQSAEQADRGLLPIERAIELKAALRQVHREIVEEAVFDTEARQKLFSNPGEVFAKRLEALGRPIEVPAHFQIAVHAETLEQFYLVLGRDGQSISGGRMMFDPKIGRLAERTLSDDEFQAALVADPKAAVQRFLTDDLGENTKVASNCAINVLVEGEDCYHVVVPSFLTADQINIDLAAISDKNVIQNSGQSHCGGCSCNKGCSNSK